MTKQAVRNLLLIGIGFSLVALAVALPQPINVGVVIGAATVFVALRISVEFLLGLPIWFFFTGWLPNNEANRNSRLFALAFSPIVLSAGVYFVWIS